MISITFNNQTVQISKDISQFRVEIRDNDTLNIDIISQDKPQDKEKGDLKETPNISLEEVKKLLEKHCKTKNTAETYFTTIQALTKIFDESNITALFSNKTTEIIDYLVNTYKNYRTLLIKLCSLLKIYRILNLSQGLIFQISDLMEKTKLKLMISQDKSHKEQVFNKPSHEGESILLQMKNKLDDLKQILQKSPEMLENWNQTAQLYAVLSLWSCCGILRPAEMRTIKILETDDENTENFVDLQQKKLIIKNHKTSFSAGVKMIDLPDEITTILKNGVNKFLILNSRGEPFKETSGFSRFIQKKLGFLPYNLRKAKTSSVIQSGNIDEIKNLCLAQGHSLSTQLEHYNNYSL